MGHDYEEGSLTDVISSEVVDAEDFLSWVWGERRGWVDLPAKVGGYWVPFHLLWDGSEEVEDLVSRRIDSCLRDGEDLYFSPGQFKRKGRAYEDIMASSWLWADLDEIHPSMAAKAGLLPTLAWQSSEGRYQCLWKLVHRVSGEVLDKLNQALSYHLGADRGGWDRTQVLRVVGTRNFKYPEAPLVRLLWYKEDLAYNARYVWGKVKASHRAPIIPSGEGIRAGALRRGMPARARTLLRAAPDTVVEGERSARLWELECLLAESGWGEEEIFEAVWASAWNKWRDVSSGRERLGREIRKAIRHISLGAVEPDEGEGKGEGKGEGREDRSRFTRYATFMASEMEAPRWMVEGIWTQGSHGMVGGEPKTLKSTLALALGMSVASGKKFLGKYPVHVAGPVLMVQEENAPWMMQDRMRKIAFSLGLISGSDVSSGSPGEGSIASTNVRLSFPEDIPFRLLNNWGYDLTLEDHQEMLWEEVKATRPVLVVLDPLYLMVGGLNYNFANELVPYLSWLKKLRYTFDTAVMVIHHYSKAKEGSNGRPGQRMLGSTIFHGWSDSALYLEHVSQDAGGVTVRIEREFRSMIPQLPMQLSISMGEPGSLLFDGAVEEYDEVGIHLQDTVKQLEFIREAVEEAGGEMSAKDLWKAQKLSGRIRFKDFYQMYALVNSSGCHLTGGGNGKPRMVVLN